MRNSLLDFRPGRPPAIASSFVLSWCRWASLLAAVGLTGAPPLPAQTGEVFQTGLRFDALTHHSGVLYWKVDCGQLAPGAPPPAIQRVPTGGAAIHTYSQQPTCDGLRVRSQNLAVTATRSVYWATGDGRIVMLPADAGPGTPPTVLGTMEVPSANSVYIAVSARYVYWTESFGEQLSSGTIFRLPIGGGIRDEVVRITSGGGPGPLVAVTVSTNPAVIPTEVVYYRRWNGALEKQAARVLPWTQTTLAPSIQGMAAAAGRLYFAEANASGASAIRSLPLNNTTTSTLHATIAPNGNPEVRHLTADSQAVYWHEVRSGTGPIVRQVTGAAGSEIISALIPAPSLENGIVSDGRHLYWGAQNATTLLRLPVNAAAITWNLKADSIEVVQAVQKPDQSVPLVRSKPAWVRLLGRVATTTSGQSSVPMTARMRGFRDGTELQGSPLTAEIGENIAYTRAQNRNEPQEGWWFRVPAHWMNNGLQLRGEINPDGSLIETTRTDNEVVADFPTMQDQKVLYLVIHPLRTHQGVVDAHFGSAYWPVVNMVEGLLPIEYLWFVDGGESPIEEWQGTPFPWSFGPYELSKSDDDSSYVFLKLGLRRALFRDLPGEAGESSIHHAVFFNTFPERAFNGSGIVGGGSLICFMDMGGEGINQPRTGVTLAHELAHNLGRKHVACGDPSGIDTAYPYPPCALDSDLSGNGHLGFNPTTRTLIRPDTASDLMSYGYPRWISDYTWKALFPRLQSSHQAPLPPGDDGGGPEALTGEQMLVSGAVASDGTAYLEPGVRLPDAAAKAGAAALLAESVDATSYRLRLLGPGGVVLATVPASVFDATEGRMRPFFAIIDEDEAAVSLDLVRVAQPSTPLVALTGGGGPPLITITAPAAGQTAGATLAIRWTATSPGGKPLRHTVRYSNDRGASWRVLAEDLRIGELDQVMANLPGGPSNNSQIEILSSDGLRTGAARSAFFTVSRRAPTVQIVFETASGNRCAEDGPTYRAGETIILRGVATDPEDGPLNDTALTWTLAGPSPASGSGSEFRPEGVRPGDYIARLRAQDSSGLAGEVAVFFTVTPKSIADVSTAPVVDGINDDAVYALDQRPILLRQGPGQVATVCVVRRDPFLYLAISGLTANPGPRPFVAISVDADNSGSALPQAGDRRFIAYADGEVATEEGNGSAFVRDASPIGLVARVSGAADRWHAEMQIALSLLGGWNGQVIGLDVAANDAHWFDGDPASATRPAEWADVLMAPDGESDRDRDRDGIADAWETANLGGTQTDGSGDRDGDGQSDAAEYLAGTDPASSASRLALTSAVATPSGLELRWPSLVGRCYDVETSTDLVEFTAVATNLPGIGEEFVFTVTSVPGQPASPNLFVRLRARKSGP